MVTLSGAVFTPTAQAAVPTTATTSNCVTATSADVRETLTATLATGNVSAVYDGTRLSGSQVDIAQTIADVGTELGITPRGIRIAIAVAMQESSLNPHAINAVYIGLFQQLTDPTTGLYTEYQRTDAIGAARMFFEELLKRVPKYDTDSRADWELGEVVQETTVGQYVQKWEGLADELTIQFVPAAAAAAKADALAADKKAKAVAKKAQVVANSTARKAKSGSTAAKPSAATGTTVSFVRSANSRAVQIQALRGPGGAFAGDVRFAAKPDGEGSGEASATESAATDTPTGGSESGQVSTTAEVPVTSTSDPAAPTDTEGSTTPGTTDPTSTPTDGTDPGSTVPSTDTTAPSTVPSTPGSTTKPTTPSTSAPSTSKPSTTTPSTTPSETGSKTPTTTTSSTAPETTPTTTAPPAPPTEHPTDPVDPPDVPGPVDNPVPDDDTDPQLAPDPEPVVIPDPPVTKPGDCAPAEAPDTNGGSTAFDPGRIISDEVFYNTKSMTVPQLRTFIDTKGTDCEVAECLKNLELDTSSVPADEYCDAYRGGHQEDVATILAKVSAACGINPQVMLVTLQKESGLLTRSDVTESSYDAAWGWHCPDTGPGGSANCDPQYAGFFNQAYGMAKQWSRYKVDPQNYNYQAGETTEILWNVAESGCGGAKVTIKNTATASLYNYTPYQPNAAALAAYPAAGDKCSAYGNRNFFFLFQKYFGVTGGGVPASISIKNGVDVTIPASPYITSGLAGKVVKAPNKKVAEGIAAGFASLGLPYVWGGGTAGGKADQGCSRGGGSSNSCDGIVGFDCSGLTGYVINKAGFTTGTNSDAQRSGGKDVQWIDALPGDIIGYSGHVAIYLGYIDGTEYLLEAPDVGSFVQIRPVYRSNGGVPVDSVLHRYWS